MSYRIDYLGDHPALAPALARAHVEAFGPLLPEWSVEEAEQELRSHAARRAIPTTLVAFGDDDWLGSVSLLQNDHGKSREWSPWLASLYVRPQARGAGVATALIRRCIDEAAALGTGTLYLYCQGPLVEFYRGKGWRRHRRATLGRIAVEVMAFDCAPEQAA